MKQDMGLLAHGTLGYLMPLKKVVFQGIPGRTLKRYV